VRSRQKTIWLIRLLIQMRCASYVPIAWTTIGMTVTSSLSAEVLLPEPLELPDHRVVLDREGHLGLRRSEGRQAGQIRQKDRIRAAGKAHRAPALSASGTGTGAVTTFLDQFEKDQKERTQNLRAAKRREERTQALSNRTFLLGVDIPRLFALSPVVTRP
jgi:hypothetical protein